MAFGQGGANVVVLGRSIDRAAQGAARVAALGVRTLAIACDVRVPGQVAAAFDQAEETFGAVTLLANNAGGNFPILAENLSVNGWNAVTRIAIDGTFLCSTEFARRLIARQASGAIVNNAAQYIWTGFPADAHSAAAKTAQAAMTKQMAIEWSPYGIRVNAIAAGFFPHGNSVSGRDDGPVRDLAAMIPIGRAGLAHEFGWLSALTCTQLMAGLSGQIIVQDGGESLRRSLWQPPFIPPGEREDGLWGWK
jgi:NAD(P)-dependent dehydrogenase (short-subunit alcohol dehydrogenase family)